MHYPFWYIPGLTSPMMIAGIAVFHIFVSSYAVGGGLFLAFEVRHAYRTSNRPYLDYLHSHAWFFILLTVVYGAITGVGIWWTIGLASPLPTEYLIHTFVFGWAMEYVFFIVEIVAAFIFYYAWGKMAPGVHQTIGWIYAISAWMSLFLITGITAFMLNPGSWKGDFWRGFLNPQTIPQTLTRTGACLLLATLYVYLHATFKARPLSLRDLILQRSAVPAMIGAALIIIGGGLWFLFMPESSKAVLTGAAALNIMMGLAVALTAIICLMFYVGPYRNPSWVTPGFAILLFALGLMVTSVGEFVREAVRKPYVIYGEVYSNNIYPRDIPTIRKDGLLQSGVWTRRFIAKAVPELLDTSGRIDPTRIPSLSPSQKELVGQTLYHYHCGSCHATVGYAGLSETLRGWNEPMIRDLVRNPERYRYFMPPWCGTEDEADALVSFLKTITPPHPMSGSDAALLPGGRVKRVAGLTVATGAGR